MIYWLWLPFENNHCGVPKIILFIYRNIMSKTSCFFVSHCLVLRNFCLWRQRNLMFLPEGDKPYDYKFLYAIWCSNLICNEIILKERFTNQRSRCYYGNQNLSKIAQKWPPTPIKHSEWHNRFSQHWQTTCIYLNILQNNFKCMLFYTIFNHLKFYTQLPELDFSKYNMFQNQDVHLIAISLHE